MIDASAGLIVTNYLPPGAPIKPGRAFPTSKKVRSGLPDQIGSRHDLIYVRKMPNLRASQLPRCFLSQDAFILIIAFNEFVGLLVESFMVSYIAVNKIELGAFITGSPAGLAMLMVLVREVGLLKWKTSTTCIIVYILDFSYFILRCLNCDLWLFDK